MTDLAALYRHRFDPADLPAKRRIWEVLCHRFFRGYIPRAGAVLDLACGYGEFINAIEAGEKHGVDLNPDTPRFLTPDVRFHALPATDLSSLGADRFDVVFTSNFLEHLPDKASLSAVFHEVRRVLRPGGRFLVMGPNIRYVPGAYWDFFDHHLPLSHLSVAEGLAIAGFDLERVTGRFLPYTTRSALPQHPLLVRLYLAVPQIWPLFGKQFFIVARKPPLVGPG